MPIGAVLRECARAGGKSELLKFLEPVSGAKAARKAIVDSREIFHPLRVRWTPREARLLSDVEPLKQAGVALKFVSIPRNSGKLPRLTA